MNYPKRLSLAAGILLTGVLGLPVNANAQSAPDAGALQRETERDLRNRLPAATPRALATPMKQTGKGATVVVRGFSLEGATLVPSDELTALLVDLIGQSLTLIDLERAAQRLASYYRAKGWLVRVYLPAQEIKDGIVRIAIVEGRLSGIKVENAGQRANAGLIERIVSNGLTTGEPVAAEALEHGLLIANDQPGLLTTGILEPGDAVGETRLRIKVEDGPLAAGDVALTNHGTRATGEEQLIASMVVNPGNGDQISLRGVGSRDLNMVRAGYSLPLGGNGLRFALNASSLHYKLGGDFAALNASGNASTVGATFSYPLRRASTDNLGLAAGIEKRRYADDSLGSPLHRKTVDVLTFTLNGDRIDGLAGGGLTQYNLAFVNGRLDLSDVLADLAGDLIGPQTNGNYNKLSAYASRLQNLPANFTLYASLAAQFAVKNLDSSEKFALGGPNGVRAYPVNEATGDIGWLLNIELRKDLGNGWNALALFDAGAIRQHSSTWTGWQGGSNTPNRYGLAGAGFGISWNKPGDIALQLIVATPLGSNPGETSSGHNQDGSARGTRGWLRLTKLF